MMRSRSNVVLRIRALPLRQVQVLAIDAVFVTYFCSVDRYKNWYIATLVAFGINMMVATLVRVKLRGLLADVSPLFIYFLYLYIAAGWSDYPSESRFWVAADGIGLFIFALFWLAARNSDPDEVRWAFVRVTLIAGPLVALSFFNNLDAPRAGGYTVPYLPIAIPFIWAQLLGNKRRFWSALALVIAVTVLVLSRSRAPLLAGVAVLFGSVLFIGGSLRQKVRLAATMALTGVAVGAVLYAYTPTRLVLLGFSARLTHKDVLTEDVYIPGEQIDPTRTNLLEIVKAGIVDAQPFGIGYMTTGRIYERIYGDYFSLHDIYQTWLFEGGVVCVLIVIVMLVRHFRALGYARRRALSTEEAGLARCILLATFAELVVGMFHQAHHGPLLYCLFGLALGLRGRVVAERRSAESTARMAARELQPVMEAPRSASFI
jgi:hypothetical protein